MAYSYKHENMLTGTVDGTGWVVDHGAIRTPDDGSPATFHLTNKSCVSLTFNKIRS